MTDPFEALREPVTPVDPDVGFAVALRMRLTREVFASSGGTMSQPTHAARVERVRAAGGHADEPERKPYGLLAECVDDQGTTFRLWQPAG